MAVRLGAESNKLEVVDNLSGTRVALFYRPPSTAEKVAYNNACMVRRGKKLVNETATARAKYGKLILTGVRDGDFEVPDGNGGWAPLSSAAGAPGYRADWKDQVAASAGHLIDTLAYAVFEASARVAPEEEPSEQAGEPGEPEEPDPDRD